MLFAELENFIPTKIGSSILPGGRMDPNVTNFVKSQKIHLFNCSSKDLRSNYDFSSTQLSKVLQENGFNSNSCRTENPSIDFLISFSTNVQQIKFWFIENIKSSCKILNLYSLKPTFRFFLRHWIFDSIIEACLNHWIFDLMNRRSNCKFTGIRACPNSCRFAVVVQSTPVRCKNIFLKTNNSFVFKKMTLQQSGHQIQHSIYRVLEDSFKFWQNVFHENWTKKNCLQSSTNVEYAKKKILSRFLTIKSTKSLLTYNYRSWTNRRSYFWMTERKFQELEFDRILQNKISKTFLRPRNWIDKTNSVALSFQFNMNSRKLKNLKRIGDNVQQLKRNCGNLRRIFDSSKIGLHKFGQAKISAASLQLYNEFLNVVPEFMSHYLYWLLYIHIMKKKKEYEQFFFSFFLCLYGTGVPTATRLPNKTNDCPIVEPTSRRCHFLISTLFEKFKIQHPKNSFILKVFLDIVHKSVILTVIQGNFVRCQQGFQNEKFFLFNFKTQSSFFYKRDELYETIIVEGISRSCCVRTAVPNHKKMTKPLQWSNIFSKKKKLKNILSSNGLFSMVEKKITKFTTSSRPLNSWKNLQSKKYKILKISKFNLIQKLYKKLMDWKIDGKTFANLDSSLPINLYKVQHVFGGLDLPIDESKIGLFNELCDAVVNTTGSIKDPGFEKSCKDNQFLNVDIVQPDLRFEKLKKMLLYFLKQDSSEVRMDVLIDFIKGVFPMLNLSRQFYSVKLRIFYLSWENRIFDSSNRRSSCIPIVVQTIPGLCKQQKNLKESSRHNVTLSTSEHFQKFWIWNINDPTFSDCQIFDIKKCIIPRRMMDRNFWLYNLIKFYTARTCQNNHFYFILRDCLQNSISIEKSWKTLQLQEFEQAEISTALLQSYTRRLLDLVLDKYFFREFQKFTFFRSPNGLHYIIECIQNNKTKDFIGQQKLHLSNSRMAVVKNDLILLNREFKKILFLSEKIKEITFPNFMEKNLHSSGVQMNSEMQNSQFLGLCKILNPYGINHSLYEFKKNKPGLYLLGFCFSQRILSYNLSTIESIQTLNKCHLIHFQRSIVSQTIVQSSMHKSCLATVGHSKTFCTILEIYGSRFSESFAELTHKVNVLNNCCQVAEIQACMNCRSQLNENKNLFNFCFYYKFLKKIKSPSYQFIISPVSTNIRYHLQQIREIIKKNKNKSQLFLIKKLSPIIRRWSNYYKSITNKKLFYFCDFITFKMLWRWACRRHHKKNKVWIKTKYFKSLNGKNWVFGFQQ